MLARPRTVEVYETASGSCPFGDGLIELKISTGPGYRGYIADDGRNALILLAGRKNTQSRDIKTAQRYWADYKARG